MIHYSNASLHEVAAHFVGNPSNDDPLKLSEQLVEIPEQIQETFLNHLMSKFKPEVFYKLGIHGDIYSSVKELFHPNEFLKNSKRIAENLYNVSTHPKILAGDLYVARIREISLHNEYCDAIVIIKQEVENKFLQSFWSGDVSSIEVNAGYQFSKIDKGCLIFSLEPGDGYRCVIIDKNTNGSSNYGYWSNFLDLEELNDSYHQTTDLIITVSELIREAAPEQFEFKKIDIIKMLSAAAQYFNNQFFDLEEFCTTVLKESNLIDLFKNSLKELQPEVLKVILQEGGIQISNQAVRQYKNLFKTRLKLDKNVKLELLNTRVPLEVGYDTESGLNFYKVFFTNESI